jgi:hypothetical protein
MTKVKTTEDFLNDFVGDVVKQPVKVETVEEVEDSLELDGDPVKEEVKTEQEDEASKEEDAETGDEESPEEDSSQEEETEDGLIFDDEEEELVEPSYEELAKELGFKDVKNKSQLIESYKKSVDKAKEDALADLPAELKEAVEFAKEGGDFKAILELNSVDYDKVSNKALVEASVQKYFLDEEGNLDRDELNDWVAGLSKAELNMRADEIRNGMKRDQKMKIDGLREKARTEKQELNSKLKSELDKIESIGGVKVRPSDREKIYQDTVSGLAMEELFYEGGKMSSKKVAENLFKVRMFDKAIHVAKTSSRNEGKRDVIDRITNAEVKRKSDKPLAQVERQSPLDQFYEMLKNKK